MDHITKELNNQQMELFIKCKYPYIYNKAERFLELGASKYSVNDAFHLPSSDWSIKDIEHIDFGCEQIMKGKGFVADRAFENLGIRGFNLLFNMFHFKQLKRKTIRLSEAKMLDTITFIHVIDKSEVTYFNIVKRKK